MPERVHTKFTDEPTIEPPTPPSTGLARYAKELHKQSKAHASAPKSATSSNSPQPTQPHGVKRSRSGSPKSAHPSKSAISPVSQEEDNENEWKGAKESQEAEGSGKPDAAGKKLSPAHTVKEDENYSVEPKTFYSTSQVGANGFRSKRSGSISSNASKSTQENRHSSQSGPRNNAVNRVANGRAISGLHTSQNGAIDSIGEPTRARPSRDLLHRRQTALLKIRKALPIWSHRVDVRWALRRSDVLLLIGETGSGKSTQVPHFIMSEPWAQPKQVKYKDSDGHVRQVQVGGMIAITEPRRLAATSLAHRVAAETGSFLGKGQLTDDDQVGYSVRFDTMVPRKARIKFLTEGMLLQELLYDPHLRKYSAVIIDEIHERSVDVDLLAGFLRNIITGDKSGRGGVPLKLIIMSATANMEGIQKFFSVDSLSPRNMDSEPANESSTQTNGEDHTTSNGTGGPSSYLNGAGDSSITANDKSASRSRDHADRRVSDASYSSWDGIASDDENTDRAKLGDEPSSGMRIDLSKLNGSLEIRNECDIDGDWSNDDTSELDEKGVVIHHIEGRQHPVKVLYTPEPVTDYIEATLKTIFKIHTQEPMPGDILAFLTGQEEIETLQELVQQHAEMLNKALPKLKVLSLFGAQETEQQREAFATARDPRTRKVILATNIAETSVTVPGVRFVIDCGKAKIKQYRTRLGLQSLLIKPISKSSAIQRKGRAGREAAGKCYRLYTEADYLKLPDADVPEILRSDVVEVVLRMKARGVHDVMSFPLLDPPDIDSMEKALLTLHSIGALDDDGELNEIGRKMANFPLSAAYSRVLVAAAEPDADCVLEIIDIIAALTADDDIFMQPKTEEKRDEVENARQDLIRREGDIITYLNAMQKYASENTNRMQWCEKRSISVRDMKYAMKIRKQLRDQCVKEKMLHEKPPPDPQPFVPISAERTEILLKCFMEAFALKTATLRPDGSYCTTLGKNVVAIHPSSVLYGKKVEAIMFLEHVYTQKNYAKKVSAIQMNWIAEVLEMA
jgi:ATP-dependent RNA helicase DHR2